MRVLLATDRARRYPPSEVRSITREDALGFKRLLPEVTVAVLQHAIQDIAPVDLLNMLLAEWNQCGEGVGLSDSDSKENIQLYLNRNPGLSLIAEQENELVGAILAGHDGRRGYLHHLAVSPDYRRQGIGKLLVNSCLKKLKQAKHTPGSSQRAQTKADDALRRQDGKNGTAHHKSSGRGDRKSIVNKIKSAEKRTGQKLSPDRKDNSKGYASSNTRAIPEKLNRGRHKADTKKLAAWRKRLKKHNLTLDNFRQLILLKALNTDTALHKSLDQLSIEQFFALISNL